MRPILTAVAVLALSACASADVMRLEPSARPPTQPDQVALLLDEPTEPYVAVALIEVSDEGWGLGLETLGKRARREAAKLGGDAVVLSLQESNDSAVLVPVGQMWMAANVSAKKVIGKVIAWKR